MGSKAPVNGGTGGVALLFQGLDSAAQDQVVGISASEAPAADDTELDLGHVEPASMLGGVVELQALDQLPGLGWGKGLVQRPRPMGVEIVQDHPDDLGLG
jgi:hypothetical protein